MGRSSIISDERTSIVLYEENQFYALSGWRPKRPALRQMATAAAAHFSWMMACIMYVSDGMGSGKQAQAESTLVVDLLEKLLAGFSRGKCPKADELCHGSYRRVRSYSG